MTFLALTLVSNVSWGKGIKKVYIYIYSVGTENERSNRGNVSANCAEKSVSDITIFVLSVQVSSYVAIGKVE